MKPNFRWLYMAILIFIPAAAFSQNEISGSVADSITGEVLPGVSIYFPELEKGTLSKEDGSFILSNLSKGTYKLQVKLAEYKTMMRSITFTGEPVKIAILLSPIVVESHGLVISTAFPTEQDNNPVEVVQVEKSEIRQSGEPTLMGALATKPGITQVSTGTNIGKPVIRGLTSNRVVVYNQGVRIENQQWGDEHGLGLSDIGIEKVEIIKGPSTLLYGSDAMGGVIHILDERAAEAGKIQGDAGFSLFSNTLGGSADAGLAGTGKIFRGGFRAGYKSHADYQTGAGYRATLTRFNEMALKGNFGFNLQNWVSNFRYSYTATNVGIPETLAPSTTDRDMKDAPHQELASHLASWQNTLLFGKHKLKINAGFMSNARTEYEEHEEPSGAVHLHEGIEMNLNTANYDVRWVLPQMGKMELITGVQGMFQHNKNKGEEYLIPDANVRDAGLLAVAKFDLGKLQLQAGARGDQRMISSIETGDSTGEAYFAPAERTFNSINGSAGLVYKASEKFLVRFNAASGFRAPNLAELHSNGEHHGTSRYEIGDLNLLQERNVEGDLGMHIHTEHITVDVSVFNNFISNYIYLAPQDTLIDSMDVFAYQQGDATLYGGEAGFDIHPHPFDWLHLQGTVAIVNAQLRSGENLPLIPPVRFTGTIRGEFEKISFVHDPWFSLNAVAVMAQNRTGLNENSTPGYFVFNIGIGGKTGSGNNAAEISLSANNLLNAKYFDHLSRLRRDNIYNMGRNISINARIPFQLKKN